MKDAVVMVVTVVVLFGTLVSINPRLREHAQQIMSNPRQDDISGAVAQTLKSSTSIMQGYAGDNTYMVTFLIAACIFVVLMLKVIR